MLKATVLIFQFFLINSVTIAQITEIDFGLIRQKTLQITGDSPVTGDTLQVRVSPFIEKYYGFTSSVIFQLNNNKSIYLGYRSLFNYADRFIVSKILSPNSSRGQGYIVKEHFHSLSLSYLYEIWILQLYAGISVQAYWNKNKKNEKYNYTEIAEQIIKQSRNFTMSYIIGTRIPLIKRMGLSVSYESMLISKFNNINYYGEEIDLYKYVNYFNFGVYYSIPIN
jgi:hypothetical protein